MALRPLEPKSSASASSATLAQAGCSHYNRCPTDFKPPDFTPQNGAFNEHTPPGAALSPVEDEPRNVPSSGRTGTPSYPPHVPRQIQPGNFDVEAVVRFAFSRQQSSRRSDDLLEDGDAKGSPKRVAIRLRQARLTRPLQNNQRVRQRRDQKSSQLAALLHRRGDRRGFEAGGVFAPSPRKCFHRVRREQRGTKP